MLATGTTIYRSKTHARLKRNFQVMPGAEWLALLCKHIPDRCEHLDVTSIAIGRAPVQHASRRNTRER